MDKTFFMDGFFPAGNHALATMPFTTKDKGSSQPFEIHFREIERVGHDYKGHTKCNQVRGVAIASSSSLCCKCNPNDPTLPSKLCGGGAQGNENGKRERDFRGRRGVQPEMTPPLAAVKIACKNPRGRR